MDRITTQTGARQPSDLLSEKAVLGLMMLDENEALYGLEKLSEKDFFDKANSLIFEAMKEVHKLRNEINEITIGDYLNTTGKLVLVGGRNYLNELTGSAYALGKVESYVNIVAQKAQLRSIIRISQELISDASTSTDASKVLEKAEREIFNVSAGRKNIEFVKVSDVMEGVIEHLKTLKPGSDGLTGIDTGFPNMNFKLSGFQRSDLVILAARPSVGKTALALNFAFNAAIKNKTVGIFSLEMSKEQMALRMLARAAMIELNDIKKGNLKGQDFEMIRNALTLFREAKLFISQAPGASVTEIRSQARKLKTRNDGLDLVIIDYLQLMVGEGESQQVMVSNISRSLKALAMELDCPVIALSQLSRKSEERKNHRPMLSDLRDSGSIEQDADIVMFLYREAYYEKDDIENRNTAELDIAKHRNGETGTVHLHWKPEFQLFRAVEDDSRYPEPN